MEIRTRRTLKKDAATGKYHTLYGCYPSRAGYESGDGGSGIAQSDDGIVWSRVSTSTPIISGGRRTPAAPAWEAGVVYQPNLVESNGTFYDFYNAAGTNAGGSRAEETVRVHVRARARAHCFNPIQANPSNPSTGLCFQLAKPQPPFNGTVEWLNVQCKGRRDAEHWVAWGWRIQV